MSYDLPSRRLVSQEDAQQVASPEIPRSRFTGSWTRKMTFDAGYIVPFLVDELVPGDHIKYDITAMVRMSTPLYPMYDNQRIDIHVFFTPSRILWTHWVNMWGEQDNPADTINYTIPQVPSGPGGYPANGIYDHMGLPTVGQTGAGRYQTVNALPLRAYNRIYKDWFRDENLINSPTIATGDGPDGNIYFLQRRAKSADYFTKALPWTQKFTPVNIPLGGNAAVKGLASTGNAIAGPGGFMYETPNPGLGGIPVTGYPFVQANAFANFYMKMSAAGAPGATVYPQVFADLANSTGIAINQFRNAFMVQSYLERAARSGSRYTETIRGQYGVVSPDFRLQRPEFIGGGSTQLSITPIAQTAPTAGIPLGALGGAGTGAGQHTASYAATEHGYVLGLISIKSELSYQQGVPRMWSRSTVYDFYIPAFAGLGEQAILLKEIYAIGNAASGVPDAPDENVFGYQERHQEYRTRYSEVTGMFRSYYAGTLDTWHLSQKFLAAPVLGQTFVEDTPPMDRVLAAAALAVNQQYLADILIERDATRPIPVFGTPVTLGRF